MSTTTTDRTQTYHDPEQTREPREVADPNTTADDTHRGLWDKATENWKLTSVLAILGTLVGGLLVWAARPVVLAIVTNTIVQYAGAALAILALGAFVGAQSERTSIAGQEELDVDYDDHRRPDFFRGEFFSTSDGQGFTPYKGRAGWWLFGSWQPYTVRDLTRDPTAPRAPAKILIPDELYNAANTDRGFRAMCRTAEIRPYPHGDGVNMILALPEDGDPDAVETAVQTMAEAKRDLDHVDDKLAAMELRMDEMQELAKAGREDTKQDLMDYAVVLNFSTARQNLSLDELEELTSGDIDVKQLDEEYAEDDDA